MVVIEFKQRCQLRGVTLLPGSRLEFAREGTAMTYVQKGVAQIVKQPGAKRKRAKSVESGPDSGSSEAAADA